MRDVNPVEVLYERPVAVFERRARKYEGVRAVVEAYAVDHSVVDAVSGTTYPDVSENIPVVVLYERPVADEERAERARELR